MRLRAGHGAGLGFSLSLCHSPFHTCSLSERKKRKEEKKDRQRQKENTFPAHIQAELNNSTYTFSASLSDR